MKLSEEIKELYKKVFDHINKAKFPKMDGSHEIDIYELSRQFSKLVLLYNNNIKQLEKDKAELSKALDMVIDERDEAYKEISKLKELANEIIDNLSCYFEDENCNVIRAYKKQIEGGG